MHGTDAPRLTPTEAARRLGVPVRAVYRLVLDGTVRGGPTEDRRAVLVDEASLIEYRRALGRRAGTTLS